MKKLLLFSIMSLVFAACDPESVFTESQGAEAAKTEVVVTEKPAEKCKVEKVMDFNRGYGARSVWKVTYEDREFLVFTLCTQNGAGIEVVEL